MGVGAAASEPGTLSMIRHIYPDQRRRARALGAWPQSRVSRWRWVRSSGNARWNMVVRAVFWFNLLFGGLASSVRR